MNRRDLDMLSESYELVNENIKQTAIAIASSIALLFGLNKFADEIHKYESGSPEYGNVSEDARDIVLKTLQQVHLYGKLGDRDPEHKLPQYLKEIEHRFPEDHEIMHLVHKIQVNNRLR